MREDSKLISISLLNHNGLGYLKKTIPSILELNYSNFEIVIFDNGSSDGSQEFLRRLHDKRIRIIKSKENLGAVRGKNEGIKHCRGIYVLQIDNDILIRDKRLLSRLKNFYEKKKNIGFLGVLFRDSEKENTKYYGFFYNSFYGINLHKKDISYRAIMQKEPYQIASFHGGCSFFKKGLFNLLDGFDEIQPFGMDDNEVGLRANLLGYKNYMFTKTCLIHLGKERDLDKKYFSKKFKYHLSNILISYTKNFSMKSLFSKGFLFLLMAIPIYSVIAYKKRNLKVLLESIKSFLFYLNNLPEIIKKRRYIQTKRVINEDVFLKINPPGFN